MHFCALTFLRRMWAWPGRGGGGACRGLRATRAGTSVNCKHTEIIIILNCKLIMLLEKLIYSEDDP